MRKIACAACILCVLPVLSLYSVSGITFDEFYNYGILGMSFTDKLQSLEGETVQITGFMAPPLKAKGNLFVLTKNPVSLCPYCNSDADWPSDIVVIYLEHPETFRQLNRNITVTGRLEMGSYTDSMTGFVSQLRLVDATYK
ncbi:hypothetical protein [Parasphaerochaeta coccoides]|uniref:DUF3299 domain-containing protein n=1 Tax=Parasphaerochaeta coccoides (strain ATCC BAA-1237 / DSM 17374 / SPN1) TaxID=760011 RepID=F4GJX2_PARC1|nr:hypothetical protein [Parasphaerochaeta coccoides]AEC01397.1 hypothetical protein Spico_0159 [Parasphaerochaeta coccoides DSM 17374]